MSDDGIVTEAPAEEPTPLRPAGWAGQWWDTARRMRLGRLALTALLAVALGFGIGRTTAPASHPDARHAIEQQILPLVLDADGIWTSASDDRAPVSEALVQFRNDGDTAAIDRSLEEWLTAYDAVLVQLAGPDLPATARPVQRQFITAVTLSRDAVELLGYAATVEDEELRRHLTREVGRLRVRAEQLTQAARTSTLDLDGQRTDVSPLPQLTPFDER